MAKENWAVKNIFSLISVGVMVAGIITGYTKLQVTVDNLKTQSVDKEVVRAIVKEVVVDKMALLQKDIDYIKAEVSRMEDINKAVYQHLTASSNFDQNKTIQAKIYKK
jgi:hypothetical protein